MQLRLFGENSMKGLRRPETLQRDEGKPGNEPLFVIVRIVLGAILIAACMDKILHPTGFAQLTANYQILPDSLVNVVAIILPWLELVLGSLLIGGVWLPGAVALTNMLLLAFFASLVFNVIRGLDVHCGCFSTSIQGKPDTAWYLLRDAAFLAVGAYLFLRTFLAGRRG
jgi:uncharacterized membrane protein YphA (DoxX/SURF4 family)